MNYDYDWEDVGDRLLDEATQNYSFRSTKKKGKFLLVHKGHIYFIVIDQNGREKIEKKYPIKQYMDARHWHDEMFMRLSQKEKNLVRLTDSLLKRRSLLKNSKENGGYSAQINKVTRKNNVDTCRWNARVSDKNNLKLDALTKQQGLKRNGWCKVYCVN